MSARERWMDLIKIYEDACARRRDNIAYHTGFIRRVKDRVHEQGFCDAYDKAMRRRHECDRKREKRALQHDTAILAELRNKIA